MGEGGLENNKSGFLHGSFVELFELGALALGAGVILTYGFEAFADSLEPFLNTMALFWLVLFAALVAMMF